jgi:phosphatidate phosphatase LPIN
MIISDIDGTVTKSDVMGHVGTVFGFDWTHPNIAVLFNKLVERGYSLLYLTSRPIT